VVSLQNPRVLDCGVYPSITIYHGSLMERSRVPLPDEVSELCNSISYQMLAIHGRRRLAEGDGSESNEGINSIKDRGGDIGRDRGGEG
jgi:hypothetical protein